MESTKSSDTCEDFIKEKVTNVVESVIEQNEEFLEIYDEDLYDICALVDTNIGLIDSDKHEDPERPQKRKIEVENNDTAKKLKCVSESSAINEMVRCNSCQILVRKKYFATHSRSKLHKNNISKLHNTLKVSVESAFGKRVISYKMNGKVMDQCQTPEIFLNSIKNEIMAMIQKSIEKYSVSK